MDDQTRKGVMALLADLEAHADSSDAKDAIGWTIVCIDLEFGRLTVYGPPYDDPTEALVRADEMHESVHKGIGDDGPGWKYIVLPVMPRDS